MDMTYESCRGFIELLASASPTPGGGGAAALVGAIGTALGNMVGSLTVGKIKYADVQDQILSLKKTCDTLQWELLEQVEADARSFLPLSRAYSIPKTDPSREDVLEEASVAACAVPLRIMELCTEALSCIRVLAEKGSTIALSDAGCGAVCCKAAVQAASLNVFANTAILKDRQTAHQLNARTNALLAICCPAADEIFELVRRALAQ